MHEEHQLTVSPAAPVPATSPPAPGAPPSDGSAQPTRTAASPARSRWSALHPLLFAAYPVLFLWSQNLGETDPADVIAPLVAVVGVAGLLTIVLGRLLGDPRRGALIVTPLTIGLLMYGHVGSYVNDFGIGALLQQLGWVTVMAVAVIAAIRLGAAWIARIDLALLRVGAILVAVTLLLIAPFQVSAAAGRSTLDETAVQPDTTTAPKRDVYWLVFDRYGSDRSLQLQYGIRNDLTPWLRDQGFAVLDESHANYISTALSLSTTLEMRHLDDLAQRQGPDSADKAPIYAMLQSPLAARQFQALGYRYLHLGSSWDPTRVDEAADVNLQAAGSSDFVAALSDASALPALARRLGLPREDARERAFRYNTFAMDTLDGLRDEPGPKFVVGHVLLPHPPVVMDRDGSFMTADAVEAMPAGEPYRRQLDYLNGRLRSFVEGLLARPVDEQPIIILQADEGPWPAIYSRDRDFDWSTASEDMLEAKFGILNAWFVPGDQDLGLDPSQTAINTFPVLFSRYFGLDYPLLPDRVATSRSWTRPYDLTDITDRLPSAR